MNNDALVAALGMDAVAAVHGYRSQVLVEAERRGLRLVSQALTEVVVKVCTQVHIIDPIDIRLTFRHCPGRPDLAGRTLCWNPEHGWSVSHRTAGAPLAHLAGPDAAPLQLVPTVAEVVTWAAGEFDGPSTPPVGVDLDDDPVAIRRLLGFIDADRPRHGTEAFRPTLAMDPLDRRTG